MPLVKIPNQLKKPNLKKISKKKNQKENL
jgi:hypothetical protein